MNDKKIFICRKTKVFFKKIWKKTIKPFIQKLIKKHSDTTNKNYKTLTPKDDVLAHTYSEALEEALTNPDVKNIAITGGYGAGKSSFIKTFERSKPQWKFLDISLATFPSNPNTNTDANTNTPPSNEKILANIEKSILEQIFYRVNPSRLPRSQFKRINRSNFGWSIFWAIFTLLALCDCCILLQYKPIITILEEKSLTYWILQPSISLYLFLMVFVYFSSIFSKIIFALSNLKLGKIGFKSIELHSNDDASLLNKHLDEILYFFENTRFDIVVFQDLDRFNNLEIFTRLRELNNLLNNAENIKRKITFLYVVKDQMLEQVDARVKFFDFLIPIVPYINSKNSKEKLIEYFCDEFRVDKHFLSGIALYITDMRILNNIYNEYKIYHQRLEIKNPTKLLAMIVYKNFEPKDFLLLHKSEGIVFDFINVRRPDECNSLKEKGVLNKRAIQSGLFANLNANPLKELKNYKLVHFMLGYSYIDDDYHSYISYFFEGSITYEERLFLQNIKEMGNEDKTDLEIKHFDAVLEEIYEYEFQCKQVLNISLFTHMLKEEHMDLSEVISYIGRNFEENQNFVKKFLEKNECLESFFYRLGGTYQKLWTFLEKNYRQDLEKYLCLIVNKVDIEEIKKLNEDKGLATFISKLQKIPTSISIEKFTTTISVLDISFENLQTIDPNNEIDNFIVRKGYYEYTNTMLNAIIKGLIPESDRIENFQSLMKNESFLSILIAYSDNNNELLIDFIQTLEKNIGDYIQKRSSINENEETMTRILNEWKFENTDIAKNLLAKWDGTLTDLESIEDDVSDDLYRVLFTHNKILPSWHNVVTYTNHHSYDINILIDFINQDENASKIANSPRDDLEFGRLIPNLFENDNFNNQSAKEIVGCVKLDDIQGIQPQNINKKNLEILMDYFIFALRHFDTIKAKGLQNKLLMSTAEETILQYADFEKFDSGDIHCLITDEKKTIGFKQKIIERTPYILINEEIAKWIFNNRDKLNFKSMELDFYKEILGHLNLENQIRFVNFCNKYFTNDIFKQICTNLPKPYQGIYSGNRFNIPYSQYAEDFAKNTRKRGGISIRIEKDKNKIWFNWLY